jgi:hypothetical protein
LTGLRPKTRARIRIRTGTQMVIKEDHSLDKVKVLGFSMIGDGPLDGRSESYKPIIVQPSPGPKRNGRPKFFGTWPKLLPSTRETFTNTTHGATPQV